MDFIFIQAPTFSKYTGDDGYQVRADSPQQEHHVPSTKEETTGSGYSSHYLPQGGLFIAEELFRRNISVAIVHGNFQKIVREIDQLVTDKTVAIGISTMSGDMLGQAIQIARHIRKNHPNKPIIWGGIHPTVVREQTLRHPLVDYIVWGEGELILPQLLEAICAGKGFENIKGIGYKIGKQTFITEKADFTPLDRVFNLPYHLLDIDHYARKMLIGGDRWLPLLTARGCPFKCTFCNNTSSVFPNNKMRFHSFDHILSNIATLVDEYGCDAISFDDELTAVRENRIIDLCHALRSLNKNLIYRMSSRVDVLLRLSDSTLRLMRDTGFISIGYGIESGSQRVLDLVCKGISVKQVLENDKRLTKFGFYKSYNFMMGIPSETLEEMKMTLRLLAQVLRNSKYCPYPCSVITPYTPLPDTKLSYQAEQYGFRPPKKLEGWVELDCRYVERTRERIRPWLTPELAAFATKADKIVAEISTHFTGKDADESKIDFLLDRLEEFASSGEID